MDSFYMDTEKVLSELGLSDGEIKVYMALLKLGSSPVSKIKEETNLHRTTIYDFIEKLLNKGLINYIIKNKVKYFSASHPRRLMDYIEEKRERLNEIIPQLESLSKLHKEEIEIEVYKGKEGLKSVLFDCIRTGKETYGIGVDDGLYKKHLPVFIEQYQRMMEENNIHEKILARPDSEYYFHTPNTKYKFMSSNSFSPITTLIFGNRVQFVLWEPSLTTILVKNDFFANAFKKHFDALWEQESMIYRGNREIKYLFNMIAKTLTPKEEYIAFGVPPNSEKGGWYKFFDNFIRILKEKGVKSRVIVDERAEKLKSFGEKYDNVNIKTLPEEYVSPAEIDIYGDNVAIILWEDKPQAFVIKNKKIARSFMQYFRLMWNIAK